MAKISSSVLNSSLSEWIDLSEPKPSFGKWLNKKWCFKDEELEKISSSTRALRRCQKYLDLEL